MKIVVGRHAPQAAEIVVNEQVVANAMFSSQAYAARAGAFPPGRSIQDRAGDRAVGVVRSPSVAVGALSSADRARGWLLCRGGLNHHGVPSGRAVPWSILVWPLEQATGVPLEGELGEGLGEHVRQLVFGAHVGNGDVAGLEVMSDEVGPDVNVLGALVKHRVLRDLDAGLIVFVQRDGLDG